MAKSTKLGGTAAQVVTIGDLDALVSRKGHQEILDGIEQVELAEANQRAEEYVGKVAARIETVRKHISRRELRRQTDNASRSDQINSAQAWRDAGIRSKFVLIQVPLFVRVLVWILFAGVDFYLFATAMVIALNEDDHDPSGFLGYSTAFWTGGVMGFMVFALGFAGAHLFRQSDYVRAQNNLKEELDSSSELSSGLRLSANSNGLSWFIGVFFAILTVVAFLVRAEGVDFKWSPLDIKTLGPLLLQASVPIVAVGIEAIMYDPTNVNIKKPNLLDSILEWKVQRLEYKLEQHRLRVSGFREQIISRYDVERASLKIFHDSQGFVPEDDELGS